MKYKAGDKVRIRSKEWYESHKNKFGKIWTDSLSGEGVVCFDQDNAKYCGKEVIISSVESENYVLRGIPYEWTDEMIEGLVEEAIKPKFKIGDKISNGTVQLTILNILSNQYVVQDNLGKYGILYFDAEDYWKLAEEILIERVDDNGLPCEWFQDGDFYASYVPDGYVIKDENGNVINATKIVLEKKKKEYPKTYEECCKVLDWNPRDYDRVGYESELLCKFQVLLLCRDAYWKIAGEEMGLGKPWEPDWTDINTNKYCIYCVGYKIKKYLRSEISHFLAFPTEEMRDAFYENFKELIEECKELL